MNSDYQDIARRLSESFSLPVDAVNRYTIFDAANRHILEPGVDDCDLRTVAAALNAFPALLAKLERVKTEREAERPLVEAARAYAKARQEFTDDGDFDKHATLYESSEDLRNAALALENK